MDAERNGWDGAFLWDHLLWETPSIMPVADPWVALAAMAAVTERIRLGPLVTPLARRRPWKVARESVTLDHLSGGRFVLGVGLGWQPEKEFAGFGDDPDPRRRAERLDEALQVITGLWSGEPFEHSGPHFRIDERVFLPTPVQRPRIPIWVAGFWPAKPPFRRAARWDGVFPNGTGFLATPQEVRDMRAFLGDHGAASEGYDLVIAAPLPADLGMLAEYAEAGVTWWLHVAGPVLGSLPGLRARIAAGPPA